MPASYIPFVTTKKGCEMLKQYYGDATVAHVMLDRLPSLAAHLTKTVPLWIDPSFEPFAHDKAHRTDEWHKFIAAHPNHQKFNDPAFLQNPDKSQVQDFISSLLNACLTHSPSWLTIPQLPANLQTPHSKVNRVLAEASANWRALTGAKAQLVLPLVFTHQTQLADKTSRNKALAHIKSCLNHAQFEGIWSVDASLADQTGTGNFEKDRFPCIIKLFEEIRALIGETKHLSAGPYWGLNLVLWARGNINHPAIGLGASYQYHVPGLKRILTAHPNVRVALAPLRRRATHSSDLKQWLATNAPLLPQGSQARTFFDHLHNHFSDLSSETPARRQVAQCYKDWFHSIEKHPPAGRALALYQDLSSAYVLGRTLGPLPKDGAAARQPERIAQQLMLNCL